MNSNPFITSDKIHVVKPEGKLQHDNQFNACSACAQQGHTCCQGHDIYITQGDHRRILSRFFQNDFWEYRKCENAAYADQDDDPIWQKYVFKSDGTRRVLKHLTKGDCVFLTPTGCKLEIGIRPLVCRLFPHTYTAQGITGAWDSDCLAAIHSPSYLVATSIAGVSMPEAQQWHQMLYQEIVWEGII